MEELYEKGFSFLEGRVQLDFKTVGVVCLSLGTVEETD